MTSSRRGLLLLEKCSSMRQLKQFHAQIIVGGLGDDSFALSRVLAFCSDPVHGSLALAHAHLTFQHAVRPSLCIRNTMIKAFLFNGHCFEAMKVYIDLLADGLYPDNYTLPYALKACASLKGFRTGEAVHTNVIKLGFCTDVYVGNMLILMYLACNEMGSARKAFDVMPEPNGSSWTLMISGYSEMGNVAEARGLFHEAPFKDNGIWGSMISGYVQNNCFEEALLMFRLMQVDGFTPDEGVLVSALSACAQLGAIDLGTWIHQYTNQVGFPGSPRLHTALIDMYLKCGDSNPARKLFEETPFRDTVCWNVMILGMAMHGKGKTALELFSSMRREGCKADDATFVAVLTACNHSGMVEEGIKIFNSMKTVYNAEPRSGHYGCLVDILCRARQYEDAVEIIRKMPDSCSHTERAIAWRSVLSACSNHGEIRLAEVAAGHLFQLEVHSGNYVLLSNIYENLGKHEDARRLRKSIKDRGVLKAPGCSSIEIAGRVHEFVAGKPSDPHMEAILSLLEKMNDQMNQSC